MIKHIHVSYEAESLEVKVRGDFNFCFQASEFTSMDDLTSYLKQKINEDKFKKARTRWSIVLTSITDLTDLANSILDTSSEEMQ